MPWLAHAHLRAGDVAGARALHSESIAFQERLGDAVHSARAYRLAAENDLELGDAGRATELYQRALELARSVGASSEVAMTLHGLGDVSLVGGDAASAAARLYLEALDASAEPTLVANCLAGLAAAAALEKLVEPAGHIWGAVESHQRRHGEQFIYLPTARRYETAFRQVDESLFAAAFAVGLELTLEEATREARDRFGLSREEEEEEERSGWRGSNPPTEATLACASVREDALSVRRSRSWLVADP